MPRFAEIDGEAAAIPRGQPNADRVVLAAEDRQRGAGGGIARGVAPIPQQRQLDPGIDIADIFGRDLHRKPLFLESPHLDAVRPDGFGLQPVDIGGAVFGGQIVAAAHRPEGFLGAADIAFGRRRGCVRLQLRRRAPRCQQAEHGRQRSPRPRAQQRQTAGGGQRQQQAGGAEEAPRKLQASDQAFGRAAERVEGVPREEVGREREPERPGRPQPQAGGGPRRAAAQKRPDGQPRRAQSAEQQRRAGRERHPFDKVLLLARVQRIADAEQLAERRAVLLDRFDAAGLVDLELAGKVVVQQRHKETGVERAERPHSPGKADERRPRKGAARQHERGQRQAQHRELKAEQVALQHAGQPKHKQQPARQAGTVRAERAPQPGRRQRQKGQRRVLAQGGAVGDIAQAVGRQRIEHGGRQRRHARPGQAAHRIVRGCGREQRHGEQVKVVGGRDRHAEQPQRRRKIQQDIAVKHADRIAVAEQPVRLDAHRETAVGQAHGDVFNAAQVVAEVRAVPDAAGEKRPAGQQRRGQQSARHRAAAQAFVLYDLFHIHLQKQELRGSIRKQSRKTLSAKRRLLRYRALHSTKECRGPLPCIRRFAAVLRCFAVFVKPFFLCHARQAAVVRCRPGLICL